MPDRSKKADTSLLYRRTYMLLGAIGGASAFAILGAVLGAIGFHRQVQKTYDVWTHALVGATNGALFGIIVGAIGGLILRAAKSWSCRE